MSSIVLSVPVRLSKDFFRVIATSHVVSRDDTPVSTISEVKGGVDLNHKPVWTVDGSVYFLPDRD
jgi:hypothetical protein